MNLNAMRNFSEDREGLPDVFPYGFFFEEETLEKFNLGQFLHFLDFMGRAARDCM